MKQVKFSADSKDYVMAYDCPDQEIKDQINEIFSDKDYELAKKKKNMIVLDIGANVGMFSLFIRDWAKKIYAIEPSRRCFDCLEKNTKDWHNIEIFNVALSNRKGKELLTSDSKEAPPQTMMLDGVYKEAVNTTTIEDFINENNIKHIDVMKIDIEGMEYIVFADKTFRNIAPKIDFIVGETHYIQRAVPEHLLLMLKQAGFKSKLLPRKNSFLWLTYKNVDTGQEEKYEVKKPTLFIAEHE